MFGRIDSFISALLGDNPPDALDDEQLHVACAALLVQAARADGVRSAAEDAKMREILATHFELAAGDVEAIIAEAQRREVEAVDVHRFTRVLHQHLDRDGRKDIVRLLWEITHADGQIDYQERNTVGLVAQLLHVEVRDAVALRRAVSRDGSE